MCQNLANGSGGEYERERLEKESEYDQNVWIFSSIPVVLNLKNIRKSEDKLHKHHVLQIYAELY